MKNNRTNCVKTDRQKNTTEVLSVQENDSWSGEVRSRDGNIRVTVNSVSGLFSRSSKIKSKQIA